MHRSDSPEIKLWDDGKESVTSNLDYGEILKINSSLDLMSVGYNLSPQTIDKVVNLIENLFKVTALSSFGQQKQPKQQNDSQTFRRKKNGLTPNVAHLATHTIKRGSRIINIKPCIINRFLKM